jgi:hypothetical protein
MPVPKREQLTNCKSRDEANELLCKYGWYPELTFNWVSYDPRMNRAILHTYYIDGNLMPSRSGAKYTYFSKEKSGIIMFDIDSYIISGLVDTEKFRELERQIITVDEGIRLCKENNQRLPVGLFNRDQKVKKVFVW